MIFSSIYYFFQVKATFYQAFFVNKTEKKLLISTKMIKRPMTYSADYVASF